MFWYRGVKNKKLKKIILLYFLAKSYFEKHAALQYQTPLEREVYEVKHYECNKVIKDEMLVYI